MTAPRSPWVPDQPDTPNVVPAPAPPVVDEPELAEFDVLIDTPERGTGAALLITAGEPIPTALAGRDRRRADAQPDTARKRR